MSLFPHARLRGAGAARRVRGVWLLAVLATLLLPLGVPAPAFARPPAPPAPADEEPSAPPAAADDEAPAPPDDDPQDDPQGTSPDAPPTQDDAARDDAVNDDTMQCVQAFEQAQLRRRKGKLLQSRAQLRVCARAYCPSVIVNKCVPWLSEVDSAIPSVVVAAQDPSGRDTADVRVTVDGRLLRKRLDGRPIEIDPGMRRFRFQHPRGRSIELQLLIVEGVKARKVALAFDPLPAGAIEQPSRPVSPVAIVGLSVAGAGLLIGAITGGIALDRGDDLAARCPDKQCTTTDPTLPGDYAEAQTLAHVSTVSLAVAGAAAVVGVIGFFLNTGDTAEATPAVAVWLGPAGVQLAGVF